MSETFKDRLMRAIQRLGEKEVDRAAATGFTVRTLDNWAAGKGLTTLEKLEAAGVVHVTGECPCSRHQTTDQPA